MRHEIGRNRFDAIEHRWLRFLDARRARHSSIERPCSDRQIGRHAHRVTIEPLECTEICDGLGESIADRARCHRGVFAHLERNERLVFFWS
ncbi:hypothetical protein WL00_09110 [Burkholderia cepacia]|nr:hypothetical protein WL00_09110 [Burkholderia cepacia]KVX63593.1 hypothetical protein WL07_33965 [Burkholderia cepacia]